MSKTALLFAGQGAQEAGMGREFADRFPLARQLYDQANGTLGYDLAQVCLAGPDSELTKTEHAQPGIYLTSWVAFRLLRERVPTLRFEAAAGLSLGEFTALAAAGAMAWQDGLKLVRARGRFMQEACAATQGTMAAVLGLDLDSVRLVCDETGVEVANLNCPGQVVISGETARIQNACELAKSRGAKRALPLDVAGAYHSRLMASAQPRLEAELTGLRLALPQVPVLSNVTGLPHGAPPEIVRRLVEQVTASVLWESSMRWLLAQGVTRFIELGPGKTLCGFLKRMDAKVQLLNVADAASLEAAATALSAGA
jgi:[acyl-carrier-protein] S-malonyltransferase